MRKSVALVLLFLPLLARADFRFVQISDTHVTAAETAGAHAPKDQALFLEISALTPKPAFVFHTGDVTESGTDAEFAEYLKVAVDLTMPHYEAPGNHDARWNPHGKEGFVNGLKEPLYQSWDYQNVHFVALDSTVLLEHLGHFDEPMLQWLETDLNKVGRSKPIVIGFHHWTGRDVVMVDNEQQLIRLLAPYNVKLWLQGHGHSNRLWSINGVPAIMTGALFDGTYTVIDVTGDMLRIMRRTTDKDGAPVYRNLLSEPLNKAPALSWTASAELGSASNLAVSASGTFPPGTKVAVRMDEGKFSEMSLVSNGNWRLLLPAPQLVGEHVFTVQASLADLREYQIPISITVPGKGSGNPSWQTQYQAVQSRLLRDGESLFVTTMNGELLALDPASGSLRWKFVSAGPAFSSPFASNGLVYFGSADHSVYAVDEKTGKMKWSYKTEGGVFAGPAMAQGILCVPSADQTVYGLDALDGKLIWKTKGNGLYQSMVATDGDRFFVGCWDNTFTCLDAKTGTQVWQDKFGKSFYYSPSIASPTVGGGKVYVASDDGILHAIDPKTGKVLWEYDGKKVGYSGPLFHNNKVYIGLSDEGKVYCFDATSGTQVWQAATGGYIYDSSFCSGGDDVYIGSVNGTFSAINAETGIVDWQYKMGPGHLLASPIADSDRVYIANMGGEVLAFPIKRK